MDVNGNTWSDPRQDLEQLIAHVTAGAQHVGRIDEEDIGRGEQRRECLGRYRLNGLGDQFGDAFDLREKGPRIGLDADDVAGAVFADRRMYAIRIYARRIFPGCS